MAERKLLTARGERHFAHIADLVSAARYRAQQGLNTVMVDLYRRIGEYISDRVKEEGWGKGVVMQLADYLQRKFPGREGFSHSNLWRMKQFFEEYANCEKLAPLVRELSWSGNLLIMGRAKTMEAREFYLRRGAVERWSRRELEAQLNARLFERQTGQRVMLSRMLRDTMPAAETVFRDSYQLDFLGIPADHSEADLRKAILRDLGRFILEFGRDFAFVGEEYRVQVGSEDFHVDLVFYHRELRCLVAFDPKIEEFKPDHPGKMSFYPEAMDRDVKKEHENPSVGVILCKGKDSEVVECSLSRTLSPALVAEYETRLPNRQVLQQRLQEAFDTSVREMRTPYEGVVAS